MASCDISGHEIGVQVAKPKLQLNLKELDIGEVSFGSTHSYEVILFNAGGIQASFALLDPSATVDSCFSFDPREGTIPPGGLQAITISFNATALGMFKTRFKFELKGYCEFVTLTARGSVIAPTFHFNEPSLDFGIVSFGFPRTLSCGLSNTSSVPITVNLRVVGDGLGEPSVTSTVLMAEDTRSPRRSGPQGHRRPMEFTITPRRGTILPQQSLDIQVDFCSNTVKTYQLDLMVDVEGIGRNVLSLPIRARCIVPLLRAVNPVMTFGQCFLKVPYEQTLTIWNDSNLPGCFRVLPQEHKAAAAAAVRYFCPVTCGIVQPHSLVDIPFIVEAQEIGEQQTVIQIAACGGEAFPLKVPLVTVGKGPVVHVNPKEINFGKIPVLQDVSQTFCLSNETPTPAFFQAEMVGKSSRWRVEPSKGVIPPNAELSVAVIVNLDDNKIFKDKVKVFIKNNQNFVVPVQATGIGHTIVTDIPPELILQPESSLTPVCYRFKVTNKGRHTHLLYWKMEGTSTFPPSSSSTQTSKSTHPAFNVRPQRMELMPGKTKMVMLECFSSTPQVLKDRLLCHAVVGNKSKKVKIMQADVTCEFVAPVLQVSSRKVTFQVRKCIKKKDQLDDEVEMTTSSLLSVQQQWVFVTDNRESQMRVGCPMRQLHAIPEPPKEESALSICSGSAESTSEGTSMEERIGRMETVENPLLMKEDDSLEAKVFDIVQRYSMLQPIESQQVRFSCRHTNTIASALALCQVEEGVTYEVSLSCEDFLLNYHLDMTEIHYGLQVLDIVQRYSVLQPIESQQVRFSCRHTNTIASALALCQVEEGVTYHLDMTEIHYGLQLFSQVLEAKITLLNSGKAGFTYEVLNPSMATADCPWPREPLILPSTGFLGPGQEQVLKIYYLPGVPGVFCRAFRVRMGHLEQEISLDGEGCFPRFSLDLPRNIKGNGKYEKVHQEAKKKVEEGSQRERAVILGEAVADGSDTKLETQIQMRMEEMLVEEHTLQQLTALASSLPADCAFDHQARCRLLEAELPEYILDFGNVVLSSVHTRTVTVTNTGQFPLSFHSNGSVLHGTGFVVEPNHVRDLPCCETKALKVCFDPESANLPLGQVDALLPIKVEEGPTFHIRLRATVSLPSLCLSRNSLEFSAVQCGQCKEETIQFRNRLQVPCKWFLTIGEPVKKVDKNVHQKLLQEVRERKPHVFTALPTAGTLSPGQRCNVKIRFSPKEETSYKSILQIELCESSQHLQLPVSGHGLEPKLEFCPPVLELGPVLPNSQGAEGTVTVKNPCEFPIEFYSLEFDHQYLKEEQILRMLKGYNSENILLLPPRAPGDKLPQELLEYYEVQKRLQDKQSESRNGKLEGPANAEPEASTASSKEAAGEENDSPVYKAIARHLGIDISAEGRAAQNHRGIVVIIHGAPLTGKTSAATALSKYYGAACLSIDAIVTEAITNSTSLAGLRARDLCMVAACEQDTDISSRRKPRTQSRLKDSLRSIASRVQSALFFGCASTLRRSSSTEGEEGFMSCVLPEDLLVEILSERLQRRDCYQGVVFDSLETRFAPSMSSALLCLLRALKNRRHIYFVNLSQHYTSWKTKGAKKKGPTINVKGISSAGGEPADPESGKTEGQAWSKKNLAKKFKMYEAAQKDVAHILSSWDRAQGILLSPVSHKEKRLRHLSILKSWKDKKERKEKNRPEKKLMAELKAADDSKVSVVEEEPAEEASRGQDIGVPCLEVQVPTAEDVIKEILESGKLPPVEQILDELGLGPSGPPIPSAAFYSVVHYPEERVAPVADPLEHFFFVDPEDTTVEDKKKSTSSHLLVPAALTVKKSKSRVTSIRDKLKKAKAVHGQKTSEDRQSSSHGRKDHGVGSGSSSKVNLGDVERAPTPQRPTRLSQCRWIVPAHGKVELKVFFSSMELGQFDQRLHFEVVGTKRQYQLQCRGTCLYPTISQDPRILSPIPNLKGPEEVTVKGSGLTPSCRFKLEDYDYLASKRYMREAKRREHVQLDPNTQVIKFTAVGVRSRKSKTFMAENPTSSTYSFQWTCCDPEDPLKQQAFVCLTERGQMKPGQTAEMQFEFVSQQLGITESSWVFTIPEQNVSLPFLLVGNATNPAVALDREYMKFPSLKIGREVEQTMYLVNGESEAFNFAFKKSSPYSEGCKVEIKPWKGSIAPLSRLPIRVVLTPQQGGELDFNLKCDVDKKSRSLPLNIKATVRSKVERRRAVPHTAEKQ